MKFTGYRFMSCSIHEAHLRYMEKCKTKCKVAEKTFAALKLKYIKTIQGTPLCGCPCDDCSNFAKTRDTLIALGIKGIPKNHSCCIEKTLCPFRNKQCDEIDIRNPASTMLYELFLLPLHSNEDGHQRHKKESTAEPPKKKKKYDNEENEDNESQKNVGKKDKE